MDARADARSGLAVLLAPVSVGEFLSIHWLNRFAFCRGPATRFASLLSWTELNTILEHHWRETFRFRLALRGRDLDPASYVDLGGSAPRIRSRDVTDHLRRGATLSFDAIDEVHEPLTRLAESFEASFHAGTQINIYAGWRTQHGLDLHCDDQEVFILQLEGRKRWLLYGHSIDGVDRSRLASQSEPPGGAALDQILERGDLLYIPRGCYHVALPMNEPTLHLTVSVKTESDVKPRPSFSLPWSATPELLPPGRGFTVQMSGRSEAASNGSGPGAYELRLGGRTFRFPSGMQWIVEQLADGSARPFSDIVDGLAGRLDEEMIRLLVGMLVKQNLIEIRQ